MNLLSQVTGPRIANDIHEPLMAMWAAVQRGWTPPTEVSRETYYAIKANPHEYASELVGFVGFLCSFGGKWWGGYAANSKGDNYADRGSRGVVKHRESLQGVLLCSVPYLRLDVPAGSVVYCDPPYAGTTEYRGGFDHGAFWDWVRKLTKDGHTVFVSEYSAPEDFEAVLTVDHVTILDKNVSKPRTEKLFKLKT